MYKQITMLITLGLVLTVGVLTTTYPQHVLAVGSGGGSTGNTIGAGNMVNGGTAGTGQNSQGNDNSQGNEAVSGANGFNSGDHGRF